MTDRRHALAFNALGSAINATGHWLPFTARRAAVDAVLAAVDTEDQAARTAARQTTPHACDNCEGIDPASCLTNPDRSARQTTGQDDTEPAPWTTDGRHGPTPEEASAAIGQCGKWGGCILDAGHTGLHRHTPRPADVEPYDHPGAAPAVGQPAEAHDTDVWTPANLHFLRFALGCAAAVMYSEDDFTEKNHAALDQLRAFAGPSPDEQDAETLAAADTVEDER